MLVLDDEERPGGRILSISGDVDVVTAPQVRGEIVRLLGDGTGRLVLDMTRVPFLDSFGLGVLVGALKRSRAAGGSLGVVVTEPRVRSVFEVTGLDDVFDLYDSVEAALEG